MRPSNFSPNTLVSDLLDLTQLKPKSDILKYRNAVALPGVDVLGSGSLVDLIMAVQKKMPDIKFGLSKHDHDSTGINVTTGEIEQDRPTQAVYLYRDGDIYVSGAIGYGQVTSSSDYKYYVCSRNICNDRGGHERRRLKYSNNLKSVVRMVKQYVQPWDTESIYSETVYDYRNKRNERTLEVLTSEARLTQSNLLSHLPRTQDYRLPDKSLDLVSRLCSPDASEDEFIKDLEAFAVASEALGNHRHGSKGICMVTVRSVAGHVVCDVLPIGREIKNDDDVYEMNRSVSNNNYFEKVSMYFEEELPEALVESLATLNVLEDEQYVPGVGYRKNSQIFYVETFIEPKG